MADEVLEEKKPVCRLAILAIVCLLTPFIIGISLALLDEAFDFGKKETFDDVLGIFMLVLFAASPIVSLLALIKISYNDNKIRGRFYAVTALVVSAFIIFLQIPVLWDFHSRFMVNKVQCSSRLYTIASAIKGYVSEHNGQLPEAARWCDLLIMGGYVDPERLICKGSDAVFGESSYVLNSEAAGKKLSQLPEDLVLVFEANYGRTEQGRNAIVKDRQFAGHGHWTNNFYDKVYKDRWNQVGGPDVLGVENHNFEGINILFADLSVRFERKLHDLRWKLNGIASFEIPKYKNTKFSFLYKVITLAIIAAAIILITALIVRRCFNKEYITFALSFGIVSGCVGAFLGNLSQNMYELGNVLYFKQSGLIAGCFIGITVGICYVMILAGTPGNIKGQKSFEECATAMGMLTGIICSTLVHILLMIIAAQPIPFGIVIGIPFGIVAGAILGRISAAVVKFRLPKQETIELVQTSGEKNEQ